MAGIPGILCRPAFQALPGRITQVLDHLGRGHRRGGVQVHRALSFLGTGHMIILSFSLQENVRTLLPILTCKIYFLHVRNVKVSKVKRISISMGTYRVLAESSSRGFS